MSNHPIIHVGKEILAMSREERMKQMKDMIDTSNTIVSKQYQTTQSTQLTELSEKDQSVFRCCWQLEQEDISKLSKSFLIWANCAELDLLIDTDSHAWKDRLQISGKFYEVVYHRCCLSNLAEHGKNSIALISIRESGISGMYLAMVKIPVFLDESDVEEIKKKYNHILANIPSTASPTASQTPSPEST